MKQLLKAYENIIDENKTYKFFKLLGKIYPHFFRFIYLVCSILSEFMPADQKRAPDFITDGCEPLYRCWELNSGPMEEQPLLITTEPSLQPLGLV